MCVIIDINEEDGFSIKKNWLLIINKVERHLKSRPNRYALEAVDILKAEDEESHVEYYLPTMVKTGEHFTSQGQNVHTSDQNHDEQDECKFTQRASSQTRMHIPSVVYGVPIFNPYIEIDKRWTQSLTDFSTKMQRAIRECFLHVEHGIDYTFKSFDEELTQANPKFTEETQIFDTKKQKLVDDVAQEFVSLLHKFQDYLVQFTNSRDELPDVFWHYHKLSMTKMQKEIAHEVEEQLVKPLLNLVQQRDDLISKIMTSFPQNMEANRLSHNFSTPTMQFRNSTRDKSYSMNHTM